MKRLVPVVFFVVVCAILTLSFKPIPISSDEALFTPGFSYVKFMRSLWLQPVEKAQAPWS